MLKFEGEGEISGIFSFAVIRDSDKCADCFQNINLQAKTKSAKSLNPRKMSESRILGITQIARISGELKFAAKAHSAKSFNPRSSAILTNSQVMGKLKYEDITGKIIGCAFEVHKFLGNGYQEVIYQRALAYEMGQAGLVFAREIEKNIFYKDLKEPIGTRRADFVVESNVLVEIKAIKELEDVHMAQILNYLRAYKLEVGLLINFGSKSMTFKRLVLSK